jgi:hypothetical protein
VSNDPEVTVTASQNADFCLGRCSCRCRCFLPLSLSAVADAEFRARVGRGTSCRSRGVLPKKTL